MRLILENEQFLTIRVRPFEDELLSSLLIRLANANGIDVFQDSGFQHFGSGQQ